MWADEGAERVRVAQVVGGHVWAEMARAGFGLSVCTVANVGVT